MPDPSLPASTTPVQDYLDRPAPGATVDHLVVPRSLAQSMPLRWQQVFVGLLADLHDATPSCRGRTTRSCPAAGSGWWTSTTSSCRRPGT